MLDPAGHPFCIGTRPTVAETQSESSQCVGMDEQPVRGMSGCFWGGQRIDHSSGKVVGMCAGASVTRPCRFR